MIDCEFSMFKKSRISSKNMINREIITRQNMLIQTKGTQFCGEDII